MTIDCGVIHKNVKHIDRHNKTCTQINVPNIKISPIINFSHKYTSVILNPYIYNRYRYLSYII
jgi:hypothetical protein